MLARFQIGRSQHLIPNGNPITKTSSFTHTDVLSLNGSSRVFIGKTFTSCGTVTGITTTSTLLLLSLFVFSIHRGVSFLNKGTFQTFPG